jgi:hypothetical protein
MLFFTKLISAYDLPFLNDKVLSFINLKRTNKCSFSYIPTNYEKLV